jgi:hypothetical protein
MTVVRPFRPRAAAAPAPPAALAVSPSSNHNN